MSFDKGLDLEEKITYVEDAEFYGAKAMAIVGISLVAGGSLQVKLGQAVLKGRKAELELRRGTSHRVIDSMKADATRGLKGASKGLEESGNIKYEKDRDSVSEWLEESYEISLVQLWYETGGFFISVRPEDLTFLLDVSPSRHLFAGDFLMDWPGLCVVLHSLGSRE